MCDTVQYILFCYIWI